MLNGQAYTQPRLIPWCLGLLLFVYYLRTIHAIMLSTALVEPWALLHGLDRKVLSMDAIHDA
jgi:hypothetical protein